ncbi:MAG: SIMPL domain-containing protein [Candidatus Tyrphobacter sp.]
MPTYLLLTALRRPRSAGALCAFLIGLLLLSPLSARAAQTTAPSPTQISVTGTGVVTLPPDQAVVSASVETYDGHSASVAVSDNAAIYDRIVAAVVALGIARADIALSSYNVSYSPPPNDRSGYTVDRSFTIKVRQLSLAGRAVDAATLAGAMRLGVSFGLSDATSARHEALQRAVADATATAAAIASAARLHIAGIASITLGYEYAPAPQALRVMAAVATPTQFDAGTTSVRETVNVIFLAKP